MKTFYYILKCLTIIKRTKIVMFFYFGYQPKHHSYRWIYKQMDINSFKWKERCLIWQIRCVSGKTSTQKIFFKVNGKKEKQGP